MFSQRNFQSRRQTVRVVQHSLQTSEKQKKFHSHYGPLGQKYMKAVLSGKKVVNIDIYLKATLSGKKAVNNGFSNDGTILDDKRIDLDKNDDIIMHGKRYVGTPDFYKLIFRVSQRNYSYEC